MKEQSRRTGSRLNVSPPSLQLAHTSRGRDGMILRTCACIVVLLAAANYGWAQDQCPDEGTPGSQSAELFMARSDGSCFVDNRGYIKKGLSYKVHLAAYATGTCQVNILECTGLPPSCTCVTGAVQVRNLQLTKLYDSAQAQYFGLVSPIGSTTQYLDTRIPEGTLSTGSSWGFSNIVGEHTVTSVTNVHVTSCNIQPAQFPQDTPLKVNVLPCKPKFNEDGDPSTNLIVHIPPGQIYLYSDLSGNGLESAMAAAAAAWTNVLSPSGILITPTQQDCGNGPSCVRITEASITGCAQTRDFSVSQSGQLIGPAEIKLREGNEQTPGWRTFGNALAYSIAHELGHYLGLDDHEDGGDAPCSTANSIMHDPISCNDETLGANIGISNYVPVNNTVYGGGPLTSCGF